MKNYTDWEGTTYFKQKGIPASCCKETDKCSEETLKDIDKAKSEVYMTVSSLTQAPEILLWFESEFVFMNVWLPSCSSAAST